MSYDPADHHDNTFTCADCREDCPQHMKAEENAQGDPVCDACVATYETDTVRRHIIELHDGLATQAVSYSFRDACKTVMLEDEIECKEALIDYAQARVDFPLGDTELEITWLDDAMDYRVTVMHGPVLPKADLAGLSYFRGAA